MSIYIISSSDPESTRKVYLEGPKVKDWDGYCSKYVEEAVQRASLKADTEATFRRSIDWTEINDALVEILKENGYNEVIFDSFHHFKYLDWDTWSNNDPLSEETEKGLIDRNEVLEDKNYKTNYDWGNHIDALLIWDVKEIQ